MTSASATPQAADPSTPDLVAEVYERADVVERVHLIGHLLNPMGVMALYGIAGGVFASLRFRSGWQQIHRRLEDVRGVRGEQVASLVSQVQLFSSEAVDSLAQLLAASPLSSSSAAAALLVSLLVKRASKAGRSQAPGRAA